MKRTVRRLIVSAALFLLTACNGQGQTTSLQGNTATIQLSTGETVEVPAQQVISSGVAHTLIIRRDGTVWAFGNNDHGQLGNGTTEASLEPVQVRGLRDIVAVSASGLFSAALDVENKLWMWGKNEDGQLGDGTTETRLTPVKILNDVQEVATSSFSTLVMLTNGDLLAWGGNFEGKFGPSDEVGIRILSPMLIRQPSSVIGIGRPSLGVVVIREDGRAWGWGDASIALGKFDDSDKE